MVPQLPRHGPPAALLAALAGAALILLLQSVPSIPPLLEYRRAALAAEPWRLVAGHFVHLNWTHALVNAGAWLVLAWLFAPTIGMKRQLASVAVGAGFISLALAAGYPSIAWYRGSSGALHALFFAGATAAAGLQLRQRSGRSAAMWLLLLVGGWMKVALEQPVGNTTPYAEWLGASTVPQAHLLGAIAGSLLGLLFSWRGR